MKLRLPINLFAAPRLVSLLSQPPSSSIHACHQSYQSRRSHHARPPSSASSSASAPHPRVPTPFVWHQGASPDDQRRISEDFSYFPCLLSNAQQHTLLNAALNRLDQVGSHASRRKRIRLLRSTDASLSPNVSSDTFIPDEYYDFEHVRSRSYRPLLHPPFQTTSSSHLSSRRTLTKSSSSFERPASHKTSGRTNATSSPSSTKSLLCSHQYLFRHIYFTWLLTVIYFPMSITSGRVDPSFLGLA